MVFELKFSIFQRKSLGILCRYVIKAVVYEIGILTEVNENSTEEDDSDDNYS